MFLKEYALYIFITLYRYIKRNSKVHNYCLNKKLCFLEYYC